MAFIFDRNLNTQRKIIIIIIINYVFARALLINYQSATKSTVFMYMYIAYYYYRCIVDAVHVHVTLHYLPAVIIADVFAGPFVKEIKLVSANGTIRIKIVSMEDLFQCIANHRNRNIPL